MFEIDPIQLETALRLAQTTLETQELLEFIKGRWCNALEKAAAKLLEQPYFAWQPNRMIIVSIPQKTAR